MAEPLTRREAALLDALERCEVVMDTAAMHDVRSVLPPAYRDSWAAAHMEARRLVSRLRGEIPDRAEVPNG